MGREAPESLFRVQSADINVETSDEWLNASRVNPIVPLKSHLMQASDRKRRRPMLRHWAVPA